MILKFLQQPVENHWLIYTIWSITGSRLHTLLGPYQAYPAYSWSAKYCATFSNVHRKRGHILNLTKAGGRVGPGLHGGAESHHTGWTELTNFLSENKSSRESHPGLAASLTQVLLYRKWACLFATEITYLWKVSHLFPDPGGHNSHQSKRPQNPSLLPCCPHSTVKQVLSLSFAFYPIFEISPAFLSPASSIYHPWISCSHHSLFCLLLWS